LPELPAWTPVLERFCETLDEVAAVRPELEPKCTQLAEPLRQFCEPPRERPDTESTLGHDDLPF
jgi:hypothetical protein